MNVKEHYTNHFGNVYSWMIGDWKTKESEFLGLIKLILHKKYYLDVFDNKKLKMGE
ncbi:hypothetical protein [Leptospira mtsangambouensis]|uniref:hypothetical protein n=1 Tax=Leptospira mtsangambouensis TaxID=2484912 RepID=UPI001EE9CAF2|nr:hypothetical protein [Leptospira mtsangambouensis]MCG6141876.1 hypothetical protein [Leptospira mtsangambouensis]